MKGRFREFSEKSELSGGCLLSGRWVQTTAPAAGPLSLLLSLVEGASMKTSMLRLFVLAAWIGVGSLTSLEATDFRRGDVNGDEDRNVADPVLLLDFLFAGGVIPCEDAADANDDGVVNIADAIALLGHLFISAGPLADPFSSCGPDPTPDSLGCSTSSCPTIVEHSYFLDMNDDGDINEGDELVVVMSSPVTLDPSLNASHFFLPVVGSSLGTNPTIGPGSLPNEIRIVLGTSPGFVTHGSFDPARVATGDPAGVDIAGGIPSAMIVDSQSLADAVPSSPADITPGLVPGTFMPTVNDGETVLVADLNHDGFDDIVIAQIGSNALWIYQGSSTGFLPQLPFASGPFLKLLVADLDGVNGLDLLILKPNGQAHEVWLESGLPTLSYAQGSSFANGITTLDAAIGDFDEDGAIDCFLCTPAMDQVWSWGAGSFTVSTLLVSPPNELTSTVVTGDYDQDGDLDVITSGGISGVTRRWNNTGAGALILDTSLVFPGARALALADFDRDGDQDLVIATSGAVQLWKYELGFELSETFDFQSDHLLVGDFDGEYGFDVFCGGFGGSAHRLLTSQPRGLSPNLTIGPQIIDSAEIVSLATASLSDGDLDLVTVNSNGVVGVLVASYSAGWNEFPFTPGSSTGTTPSQDIAVGELNSDGLPDVVTVAPGGVNQAFINADGVLQPGISIPGTESTRVQLVDALGGTAMEIFIANGSFTPDQLYENTSTTAPIFGAVWTGPMQSTSSVEVIDFDRDGHLDLISGTPLGLTFHNDFLGPNSTCVVASCQGPVIGLTAGRILGDTIGLVAGSTNPGTQCVALAVNCSISFDSIGSQATVPEIHLGDLNRDGIMDIVMPISDGGGTQFAFQICYGSSPGVFPTAVAEGEGLPSLDSQLLDYNRDGWLDLITVGLDENVRVWRGSPSGYSVQQVFMIPGANCISSGDLDQDGDEELVVGSDLGGVTILWND